MPSHPEHSSSAECDSPPSSPYVLHSWPCTWIPFPRFLMVSAAIIFGSIDPKVLATLSCDRTERATQAYGPSSHTSKSGSGRGTSGPARSNLAAGWHTPHRSDGAQQKHCLQQNPLALCPGGGQGRPRGAKTQPCSHSPAHPPHE